MNGRGEDECFRRNSPAAVPVGATTPQHRKNFFPAMWIIGP